MIQYLNMDELQGDSNFFTYRRTKWIRIIDEFIASEKDVMVIHSPEDVGCESVAGASCSIYKAIKRFGYPLVVHRRGESIYVMKK